jgi:hypothetical protein
LVSPQDERAFRTILHHVGKKMEFPLGVEAKATPTEGSAGSDPAPKSGDPRHGGRNKRRQGRPDRKPDVAERPKEPVTSGEPPRDGNRNGRRRPDRKPDAQAERIRNVMTVDRLVAKPAPSKPATEQPGILGRLKSLFGKKP